MPLDDRPHPALGSRLAVPVLATDRSWPAAGRVRQIR
jgi:hypothetical protein